MTRSGTAISARGTRKSFGEHTVLDDVDLEVGGGTIFSLLGPNGAGKTTIVRILSTLIRAEAGTIRVAGHDPAADPDGVRAAISVTGQFSAVDNLLTGEENLQPTCATSVAPPGGGGWPSCWTGSSSPTRPASRCRPTPAACGAAWTWRWDSVQRPALSPGWPQLEC